ncbi:MAG: GNAT family N-acetyltransferase [Caldilinea sp. CFX5]|nr:GNAT family N-acetyltransferase [Caldilinea sp. CFX5]
MLHIHTPEGTAVDYATIASVRNAVWTDEPVTVEQLRHFDESWPAAYLSQRLLVEMDGIAVAVGHYFENHWQYQPGKYDLDLVVHPDYQGRGIGAAVYDYVTARLAERSPAITSLVTSTREDQRRALRFLADRGFQTTMRWARSQLTIAAFDFAQFAQAEARPNAAGIHLYSLQELAAQDPTWQYKAYALDQVAGQDAPSPDPMNAVSFESYVENTFGHPGWLPAGCFAAVAGNGMWVGITELGRTADPHRLNTPWTAVHPGYRRHGIATALKVRAIRFAQNWGAQTISASNEENNPMYQLNLQLGFTPLPAALTMKKIFQ